MCSVRSSQRVAAVLKIDATRWMRLPASVRKMMLIDQLLGALDVGFGAAIGVAESQQVIPKLCLLLGNRALAFDRRPRRQLSRATLIAAARRRASNCTTSPQRLADTRQGELTFSTATSAAAASQVDVVEGVLNGGSCTATGLAARRSATTYPRALCTSSRLTDLKVVTCCGFHSRRPDGRRWPSRARRAVAVDLIAPQDTHASHRLNHLNQRALSSSNGIAYEADQIDFSLLIGHVVGRRCDDTCR